MPDSQGYQVRPTAFDQAMGIVQVYRAIKYAVGPSALDAGSGPFGVQHLMMLSHFVRVDLVDEGLEDGIIGHTLRTHKGNIETWKGSESYSTIFLTNVLEHVKNPVAVLKNLMSMLYPGGRLIIQVPNGFAMNRRVGASMGLTPKPDFLSPSEMRLHGHVRVYNNVSLVEDIEAAGGRLVSQLQGVVLKPLTNTQMSDLGMDNLRLALSMDEFSYWSPMLCSNLLAVVEQNS